MNEKQFQEHWRKLPKKFRNELGRRMAEGYDEAYKAGQAMTFQEFLDSDEYKKSIKKAMADGYWEAMKVYDKKGRFF